MLEPYLVERLSITKREWHEVMSVPKATIADARRWLVAQGHQWTTTHPWRIVDRKGECMRTFFPRGY